MEAFSVCDANPMAPVNRESKQQQWGCEGTNSGVANGPAARRQREEATWEEIGCGQGN
ncbi:hypothetical protein ACOSQ2_003035 [Xanthoceras sorbifolium]